MESFGWVNATHVHTIYLTPRWPCISTNSLIYAGQYVNTTYYRAYYTYNTGKDLIFSTNTHFLMIAEEYIW